jgi:PAS domain S-box-containing protein
MKFLIIDDRPEDRALIIQAIRPDFNQADFIQIGQPHEFETALTGTDESIAVALTDSQLAWANSIEIIQRLKARWPHLPVIMVAHPGSEMTAIEGMKVGLSDYANKAQLHRLPAVIQEALIQASLRHSQELKRRRLPSSENFYQALFETISDYAYMMRVEADGTYTIEWLSDAFIRVIGFTVEKINAGGWRNVIHPDDLGLVEQHMRQKLSGQSSTYEFRVVAQDGSVRWLHETGRPVWDKAENRVVRILGVAQDITQRKRTEEEIRRRNRELTLLNQIIAVSAANPEPEVLLEAACRELAAALDSPRATATLLREDKKEVVAVAEYRAPGEPSNLGMILTVKGNPLVQNVLIHRAPFVVHNTHQDPRVSAIRKELAHFGVFALLILPLIIEGEVVGSLSIEATQPRQFSGEEINLAWSVAEQVAGVLARVRLAQVRQRLSAAIEQAADNIIITDIEGKIIYVNPAFERISGYNRVEVIGQTPHFLDSNQSDQPAYYQGQWSTLTSGQVWRGRLINKHKDGSKYIEDVTITPVRNEDRTIVSYVSAQRDVTRELSLEEQLSQSQKMEAIGRLAGGVAHDFNNLLTVITGYSELLMHRPIENQETQRSYLEEIYNASERAAALTRQLLAFSRKQVLHPEVLNLNKAISGITKMLRRLIGEDIEMVISLSPSLGMVKADPGQLEQVIVNLVVNARDAMPNGGRLIIETSGVTLDESYVSQHVEVEPGPYVMLAISDTGIGMDKETISHIFEPFFTTKEPGKGTGLGLAMVHGIVKQSSGHIWVYSEPDQGTTIKIYLPLITTAAESTNHSQIDRVQLQGTETVLVVEDDVSVRSLICQFLRKSGYTVLEATTSTEAFQLAYIYHQPIHLLLADMVLPGINGLELARQLTGLYPQLKVLYISGYTDNAVIRQGMLEPGAAFLQKPFTPTVLGSKVREVLDAPIQQRPSND